MVPYRRREKQNLLAIDGRSVPRACRQEGRTAADTARAEIPAARDPPFPARVAQLAEAGRFLPASVAHYESRPHLAGQAEFGAYK